MKKPDIHRLLALQDLLLQFQSVERVVHIPKTFRKENDTEHSYNLALAAWYLAEYFPELDRDLAIRFALVHDLVEVHAGDTYIYADPKTLASKESREAAALEKLRSDWPDFPEMLAHIEQYEARISPEAKFVYALDKIMPILVIFLSGGHSWQKEHITLQQIHAHKKPKVAVSPEIKLYYDQLYALLLEHEHYFPTGKRQSKASQQG